MLAKLLIEGRLSELTVRSSMMYLVRGNMSLHFGIVANVVRLCVFLCEIEGGYVHHQGTYSLIGWAEHFQEEQSCRKRVNKAVRQ